MGTYSRESYQGADGQTYRVHALNRYDTSPTHNHMHASYGGSYDARCSCCWLNIAHTTALHGARVAEAEALAARHQAECREVSR